MNDHVALRSSRNQFSLLISQISFYKSDTSRSKLGTVIQRERRAKTDTVMTQLSEHLVCRGAGYPDIIMSVDAIGGGGGGGNNPPHPKKRKRGGGSFFCVVLWNRIW